MDDFDTEFTNNIVCPHCGKIDYDVYESIEDPCGYTSDVMCNYCEKYFDIKVHISYSTYKSKYGACSLCGTEAPLTSKQCSYGFGYGYDFKDYCETCTKRTIDLAHIAYLKYINKGDS